MTAPRLLPLLVGALAAVLGALAAGCGPAEGRGFDLVAFAAGPEGASGASGYTFTNALGFDVHLTTATLHVGALYLDPSGQTEATADGTCHFDGVRAAELVSGLDVDLLSSEPQRFPDLGTATGGRATTGEAWLTGGDVDTPEDATVILALTGTASSDSTYFPFEGALRIDDDPEAAEPACARRIVAPLTAELAPTHEGALLLRVDPAGMLANVDFSALPHVSVDPPLYRFVDAGTDAATRALYAGLEAPSAQTYSLAWDDALR